MAPVAEPNSVAKALHIVWATSGTVFQLSAPSPRLQPLLVGRRSTLKRIALHPHTYVTQKHHESCLGLDGPSHFQPFESFKDTGISRPQHLNQASLKLTVCLHLIIGEVVTNIYHLM